MVSAFPTSHISRCPSERCQPLSQRAFSSSLRYSFTKTCSCVLMRMDAFKVTGNVSKERKDFRGPLENPKMWNEFVYQFRPVCDHDPTMLLTHYTRKESWQRVVIRWGHSPHLQGFHRYFKSCLFGMTDVLARGRKLCGVLT
ncbi:uncharacterized protein TNCV_2237761 [Trichonephila clavipes]|nr:uncharacterized protein TNCV_2237761 [Trichonephila clavipes]